MTDHGALFPEVGNWPTILGTTFGVVNLSLWALGPIDIELPVMSGQSPAC